MSGKTQYLIPEGTKTAEQEITKSRFIATVGHTPGRDSAKKFIEEVSAIYADATHNTYAFIPSGPDGEFGFSDDGEPSGVAGKPMLSILQHRGIGEITAVVTRYYGGTNLGTGGLVRAYSGTLMLALDNLRLIERVETVKFSVITGYGHENAVRIVLEKAGAPISDAVYTQEVTIESRVPEADYEELKSALLDSTRGQAEITIIGE